VGVAGLGAGLTVRAAVPDTPLSQSMDGEKSPGLRSAGGSPVPPHSPISVAESIGICSGRPSVVPNSVAEVEPVPQVIAKVTLAPGVAVDGVTSMTGLAANAGPAERRRG